MKTQVSKLEKIAIKYRKMQHNDDNYGIGGGLDNVKFASRRHEDAKSDVGKLTLGEANTLFAKATGLTTCEIREIINFRFKNLEWHHAGKLPKKYGGGMKKTYFLKSFQIVELAENFEKIQDDYKVDQQSKINYAAAQKILKIRRDDFLKENATKVSRVPVSSFKADYFIAICYEMNGKYGWFESDNRYNLPEYITAWVFESAGKKAEYQSIN